MKKYRCILVDDEPLARELIAGFIAECPELELVAELPNAIDARAFLQQHVVDLMFLDINNGADIRVIQCSSRLCFLNEPRLILIGRGEMRR